MKRITVFALRLVFPVAGIAFIVWLMVHDERRHSHALLHPDAPGEFVFGVTANTFGVDDKEKRIELDGYDAGTKTVGFRLVWLDGARPSQRKVLEVCAQILQAAAPSEFWEQMRIHTEFPSKDVYGRDAPAVLRLTWKRSEINRVNWREFDAGNLPRLAEGGPSPRAADAPASLPAPSPSGSADLAAAYALCDRGDVKGFAAALDKVIECDPRSAEALADRAFIRFLAGNHDESEADAGRAIELTPNDRHVAMAYYCRGQIEGKKILSTSARGTAPDESRRALSDLNRAVELDAGLVVAAQAHFAISLLSVHTAEYETAARHMSAALRLAPGDGTIVKFSRALPTLIYYRSVFEILSSMSDELPGVPLPDRTAVVRRASSAITDRGTVGVDQDAVRAALETAHLLDEVVDRLDHPRGPAGGGDGQPRGDPTDDGFKKAIRSWADAKAILSARYGVQF